MEENQTLNTETTTTNQTVEEVETQQPVEVEEKMLPQSRVNEIVESRLKREREKLEKQFTERINALEENIKLQAMTEQEKANYQAQKELEAFEEERKAFYAERDAFNKEKYRATIEQELRSNGLPTDMADLLVGLDAETVKAKIDGMKQSFTSQLNAQVQSKVQASATTPVMPNEQVKPLTMEDIAKMSHQEIIKRKAEVDKVVKEYYMTK